MWGRVSTSQLEWQQRVGDGPTAQSVLLSIGGARPAQSVWWTLELDGEDAEAFDIASPSTPLAVGERELVAIEAVYLAPEVGTHAARLVIKDEEGEPVASFDLAGQTERRNVPWLADDRESVSFGEVLAADTRLGVVTVASIADGDTLDYECSLRDGVAFECAVTSRSVESGVALCLNVAFTPTAEQSYDDALTIAWTRAQSEPLSGSLVVALSGAGVLDEQDDDALDGGDAGSSDADPSDAKRRATWIVPSHESIVSLGARYLDGDSARTQHGFSASTNANVFLDAGKTATVQADGNVWFQSHEDNAHVYAGGNMHVVSAQTVYIGGGVYAGLMAGYGAGSAPELKLDGKGTPEPPSLTPMSAGFAASEISWLVLKRLASAYNIYKKSWDSFHLADPDSATMGGKLRTGAWKSKYAWKSAGMFLGAAAGALAYRMITTGTDAAGLSLFSEAGLNAGTPGFTTIAGSLGTFATGLNATVVGYADVSLRGTFTNLTTIGDAAVIAGGDVRATTTLTNSHLLVGSRAGTATYTGAYVKVGTVLPDGASTPTQQMTIDAMLNIGLEAVGPGAEASVTSTSNDVVVQAAGEVEVSSGARTLLELDSKAYTIDVFAGGFTVSDAQGVMLTVLPGTVLMGAPGGQVVLGPGMADLGGMVTLTPASLSCPAAMVELL